jgi:hypothetical protein
MKELKLKLPISIETSTADKGYVITDANNTEYFFYEEDGVLVYDGCCVEPERIDIIVEYLDYDENNPNKSLTRNLGDN